MSGSDVTPPTRGSGIELAGGCGVGVISPMKTWREEW